MPALELETSASQVPSPNLSLCLFPQTVTCFFTVDSEPWATRFQLLNDTCLGGSAE